MRARRSYDPVRDHALLVELAHRLRAAGCFAPCDHVYARRLMILIPLFISGFAGLYLVPPGGHWALFGLATGFVAVQLGVVSHDAGHRAVHHRQGWNELWGHVGMTLVCGLSFHHWRLAHDAHHHHPQDARRDPDMHAAAVFSADPRDATENHGLTRLARPVPQLTFWPLGALYAWSLRWDSITWMLRTPDRPRADRWILPAHYVLWLIGPAVVVGPLAALASYALVSTVISLYLVAIFAPGHIGMPSPGPGERVSQLEHQLTTARDLHAGPVLAIVMRGLEHQIEHHLFPRIAQPHLRTARSIVRAFCTEHGLPHHSAGFIAAHREVMSHLAQSAQVGAALAPPGAHPCEER